MPTNKTEPWGAIAAAQSLAGSEQREHIEYNPQTQVLVQILQAIALIPTGIGLLAGLGLLGRALWHILQAAASDMQLIGLAASLFIIGWIVVAILRRFTQGLAIAPLWRTISSILGGTVTLLLLLNLLELAMATWTWQDTATFALGCTLILACSLLGWRFSNELFNPAYPKTPFVKMLEELVGLYRDEETEIVHVLKPYPVYLSPNSRQPHLVPDYDPGPLEDDTAYQLDPGFADLLDFLHRASQRGLSRESLVTQPRIRLPSGRRLTRPAYDDLVAEAVRWGLVDKGGEGRAASWLIEPDKAIRLLQHVREQFPQAGRQPGRQVA